MLLYLGISTMLLAVTTAVLLYIYMTRNFKHWENLGVPYIPAIPFFGNYYETATFKVSLGDGLKKLYDQIDSPFIGIFVFDNPVLMLKSPKLVHDVLIKDSAQFTDRTTALPTHDKVSSNILFLQKGDKWKQSRAKISPIFSPSKLKRMFSVADEVCLKLLDQLSKENVIDLKDILNRFGTELVARCFFGISTNSMEKQDSEFFKKIRRLFDFTWRNVAVHSAYFMKPEFVKWFRLDFTKRSNVDYVKSLLLETLKTRENIPEHSRDLVDILKDMLHETKSADGKIACEDIQEILGHAITFFFAGSDTVSILTSLTLYELTLHEDIQDRLRNEILKVVAYHGGITYESIHSSKLLAMCISETSRKYPLLAHICRTAKNAYHFSGTNLTIDKGTSVYIPLCALHLDEKYFPNPTNYNPYRFEDLSKTDGQLYFLPFGDGPRVCPGERFSIMVMKIIIMHVLLKFKLKKCSTTPDNVKFAVKSFFLRPESEMEISVEPI